MGWLLDLFPAWANGLAGSAIALIGVAALFYGLIPVLPYGRIMQAAGAVALAYACYTTGFASAQSTCDAERLREELAAARRDLAIATTAAADASRRAGILNETLQVNQNRIDDYEAELAARPDARCILTGDDLRGVLGKP